MDSFRIQSKELWLEMLSTREEELQEIIKNKSEAYSIYKKKKRNGTRIIYCINHSSSIYKMQKQIHQLFFKNIYYPDCVYGFRPHRSYIEYLIPHISESKNRHYLRLDIKDFFNSITIENARMFFKYYVCEDVNDEDTEFILNSIIEITTIDNKFIQGAVTSPAISNYIFRQLDIRIEKYCQKLDVTYTRYADDMLFSSESSYIHRSRFISAIKAIIKDQGFKINSNKTLKYKKEISINGYVIGNDIRLSRKKLYNINKILYNINKSNFQGFETNYQKYTLKNKLAGYRAYLIQLYKYVKDNDYKLYLKNKIDLIEKNIFKYCSDL